METQNQEREIDPEQQRKLEQYLQQLMKEYEEAL